MGDRQKDKIKLRVGLVVRSFKLLRYLDKFERWEVMCIDCNKKSIITANHLQRDKKQQCVNCYKKIRPRDINTIIKRSKK